MTEVTHKDLTAAAATWNDPNESMESVNARIHGGVPLEKLTHRANSIVEEFLRRFAYLRLPPEPTCLEIGSGTGYIMEALNRQLGRRGIRPSSITGLDIAENMLARAKLRLGNSKPFQFLLYDGIIVPLADGSQDFIYSVSALQHVPKPFVYNLFFEMHRLLKSTGVAVFTLLPFNCLAAQEHVIPWRIEVRRQITLQTCHWHHYYCKEELENVLRVGTKFLHVDILDGGALVCVSKSSVPPLKTS